MLVYEDLNIREFSKILRQLFATPQPLLRDTLWGRDPPLGTTGVDISFLNRMDDYFCEVGKRVYHKKDCRVVSR